MIALTVFAVMCAVLMLLIYRTMSKSRSRYSEELAYFHHDKTPIPLGQYMFPDILMILEVADSDSRNTIMSDGSRMPTTTFNYALKKGLIHRVQTEQDHFNSLIDSYYGSNNDNNNTRTVK